MASRRRRQGRSLKLFEPREVETPRPSRPANTDAPVNGTLLETDPEDPSSWGWIECVFCRGQGWLARAEWMLAWLHPEYPDVDAIEDTFESILEGRRLHELSVREQCQWCNGSGRRYDIRHR